MFAVVQTVLGFSIRAGNRRVVRERSALGRNNADNGHKRVSSLIVEPGWARRFPSVV